MKTVFDRIYDDITAKQDLIAQTDEEKISRRRGVIPVTFRTIEDAGGPETNPSGRNGTDCLPTVISSCFHDIGFLPLQVITDCAKQRLEYTGISPAFAEIPEGGCAPEYEILVSQANGELQYEVKTQ